MNWDEMDLTVTDVPPTRRERLFGGIRSERNRVYRIPRLPVGVVVGKHPGWGPSIVVYIWFVTISVNSPYI